MILRHHRKMKKAHQMMKANDDMELQYNVKAGMSVVMTKEAALSGGALLARKKYEELIRVFPRRIVDRAVCFKDMTEVASEIELAKKEPYYHEADYGGIFGGLWELAAELKAGLNIDLRAVPLRQEIVEICEYLRVNPYTLKSKGALLIVTPKPMALIAGLKDEGIRGTVIGMITEGNDKLIFNEGNIRYLDKNRTDSIEQYISDADEPASL